ncbi:unnamed protein product [Polarella glacialis]|uniref:Uncharacterized protein n=1 Tax=Polarella glacialis TaxID=89957 RepID=A0A813E190_POLGL|nr:unnamed protein product [Polarella glacialis]
MEWMWNELFLGHQDLCPLSPRTAAIGHSMAMDELAQRFPEAVKKQYGNLGLAQTAARRSLSGRYNNFGNHKLNLNNYKHLNIHVDINMHHNVNIDKHEHNNLHLDNLYNLEN